MSSMLVKDLPKRLITSSIVIGIVGLLIYFSQNKFFSPIFGCVLALLSCVGLYEYVKMIEKKQIFLSKAVMFVCATFLIFAFYLHSQLIGYKLLPIVAFCLALFLVYMSRFNKIEGALSYIALFSFGLLYIVIPIGLILPIIYFKGGDGRLWLVYVIVVTKIADIGGYFGGKLLGKHKLAEKISPNKTIEGALVGFLFSVGSSWLFFFLFNAHLGLKLNGPTFVILGVILGTLGQIGDLLESLLKRDAGIKDSNVLPGLGGVLDMLDSLLFNIPFVFFFLKGVL